MSIVHKTATCYFQQQGKLVCDPDYSFPGSSVRQRAATVQEAAILVEKILSQYEGFGNGEKCQVLLQSLRFLPIMHDAVNMLMISLSNILN